MENKIYGRIYLITNLINGKQYVGQTTLTINKRFNQHCYNINNKKCFYMPIVRAIKKYGKENFKIEEIAVAYTQKQLNFSEGFFISLNNTLSPNGYNLINIINGKSKHSKSTKEKMKFIANSPKRLKLLSTNGKKCQGKCRKNSLSKFTGVGNVNNIYTSQITFNNKQINLGRYNNEIDAAKSYDIAAIKYFGNNAILNFPKLREDYIKNKIFIKKRSYQDYSKSGEESIYYHSSPEYWVFRWFDINLQKNKTKRFKLINDAIKFKQKIILNGNYEKYRRK